MKEERAEHQESALVSSDLQHGATEQYRAQTDNTELQPAGKLDNVPDFQFRRHQSRSRRFTGSKKLNI